MLITNYLIFINYLKLLTKKEKEFLRGEFDIDVV